MKKKISESAEAVFARLYEAKSGRRLTSPQPSTDADKGRMSRHGFWPEDEADYEEDVAQYGYWRGSREQQEPFQAVQPTQGPAQGIGYTNIPRGTPSSGPLGQTPTYTTPGTTIGAPTGSQAPTVYSPGRQSEETEEITFDDFGDEFGDGEGCPDEEKDDDGRCPGDPDFDEYTQGLYMGEVESTEQLGGPVVIKDPPQYPSLQLQSEAERTFREAYKGGA